uniref:Uncharacterized protein n=1 Tax=Acrobeloides nanus TaxID=290746 RepID=A0A914E2F3_9BILA
MMGLINTPDETTMELYSTKRSKPIWNIGYENMNLNKINDFVCGKLEQINFYMKENCTIKSKFSELPKPLINENVFVSNALLNTISSKMAILNRVILK